MPLLAAFFGSVIVAFAEWLMRFFAKRVAFAVAVIGVLLGSFAAVLTAVHAMLGVLVYALPAELAQVFLFAFPSNISACISAYVSVYGVMCGWQWHRDNVKLAARYVT